MKTLLVLGASSDIANVCLRHLELSDTTVLAHYHRSLHKVELAAKDLKVRRFVPLRANLADAGDVDRLIQSVRAEADSFPTHILHLAAPNFERVHFHKIDLEEIETQFAVQVMATARVLHALLPDMVRAGRGKIVFLLSSYTIGERPVGVVPYTVAKYAQLGLMRALVGEYARRGICINAVSPSMVDTSYISGIPRIAVEMAADQNPLKRLARPEDIAPIVRFLLSEESNYINGANIPVCGGGVY
jgi:3-oxoacyl-[acyl-carrier protein] reductase